ncbi:hypothetical protein GC209_02065 [bacterium]|nr:hypothetical protein [bacterium]
MPDYLGAKDWKAVLDMKEHKSVKKTGVSDTLDEYAAAKKKGDLGRMVSALERIAEKAGEVKTAQSKFPKMVTHLTEMIKAAKAEQQKLAPRLGEIANKGDADNEDSTLGKQLARIRQVDADGAWNFVLVPGKPASGFVVSKKAIKKSDTDKAFEMRGKRAPYFTGRIFFQSAKYVLDLGPETSPIPGLAKAAKTAALLHAEVNIKAVVRGMGKELDSESDIEPQEEGSGTVGSQPLTEGGHNQIFADRIEKLKRAVASFQKSPTARKEGAADGLFGAIKVLLDQIEADDQIGANAKFDHANTLAGLRLILTEINAPAPGPKPEAKYPDEAYWQKLAEQVVRLDPDKRAAGWERYKARLQEMVNQFKADTDLVDPGRAQVFSVLRRAGEIGKEQASIANQMVSETSNLGDPAMERRFLGLERRYDQFVKAPGIDPAHVKRASDAFAALRDQYRKGELTRDDPRLAQIEKVFEQLAKAGFQKQQETSRRKGQEEMHQSLSQAMPLLKKAALPVGMVKDPNLIRERGKTDADLRALVEAMSGAAKTPGKDSAATMEKAARQLLAVFERRRTSNDTPFDRADTEIEAMAVEALRRAQMMKMTTEYETLGAPPWDPAKADIASELQAQLFFLEGGIAQGKPNYEAPRLGGDDGAGASGSWWIERTEANTGDGTVPATKKKYIFKPGNVEAVAIGGMPPGSGAPREVLAKRLDEMMSGAGFSVGVSPTTLARIDSSQLGSINEAGGGPLQSGVQVGSMQQLAPSDGPLADKMQGTDGLAFMKSIDKRSFDDVAVFDMIFANLDRHAKNLLVLADPETGRNTLVPIDHGSSLPDPEMLQLNRRSLMGGTNVLANPQLPQTAEPLGPEALEALDRLDPDAMVAEMKQARRDMEGRHKETEGTVTDAAIDAMGARIRFVKLAAKTVPVAEMFEMLALGAMRIAKARPEDIPDLIETLRAEVRDLAEVSKGYNELVDSLIASGDGAAAGSILNELSDLGWAWGTDKKSLDDWIVGNASLVGRVLKGRIPNPAAVREINRLTPLAKEVAPNIERQLAGKPLGDQARLLLETVNGARMMRPARDTPIEALKEEFESLGGTAALERAFKAFPGGFVNLMPEPVPDPEDEDHLQRAWGDRIVGLRGWRLFEEKGGIDAMVRVNATMPREASIETAIILLDEAQLCAGAVGEVAELDEEELNTRTANAYEAVLIALNDAIRQLREPYEKAKMEKGKTAGTLAWQEGKTMAAVTTLAKYARLAQRRLESEAKLIEETTRIEEKLDQDFQNALPLVQEALRPHMQRIKEALEEARETASYAPRYRAVNEFNARIEIAEKGEESQFHKMRKLIEDIERRAGGHARLPWHDGILKRIVPLREMLDKFDVRGDLEGNIMYVVRDMDSLDTIKAELGNADPGNLPQPVIAFLQDWGRRMGDNSGMNRIEEAAKALGKLMSEAVN